MYRYDTIFASAFQMRVCTSVTLFMPSKISVSGNPEYLRKVFYILTLRKTYCKRISVLFFMHHAKVLNFPVFFLLFLPFSLLF